MPNVGPLELVIVAAIVLIIFGPRRLPELGRSIGRGIRELRAHISTHDQEEDEEGVRELPRPEAAEQRAQPPAQT